MIGRLLRFVRAGERKLAWNRVGPVRETLQLSSPAFIDGGRMPARYAGQGLGDNISPPLHFAAVPSGTAELVLIVQDVDAPTPRPIVHLIARLAANRADLPEAALRPDAPLRFGMGSFGSRGYAGPRPIAGHGPHRYVFQVFAMPQRLQLADNAGLKAHLAAMRGNVLARGRMTGVFEQP